MRQTIGMALVLTLIAGWLVGFASGPTSRAGPDALRGEAAARPAEAQLDLSQKIRRADERIERESPSQASIETRLKRLERYAVDRQF